MRDGVYPDDGEDSGDEDAQVNDNLIIDA